MLKYPNKSHRKIVTIPAESKELAELFGIAFGDGGINNDWQLVITLNAAADLAYSKYIDRLLQKLFGLKAAIRKRPNRNALVIVSTSSNLIDYLVQKGAVRGNKVKQQIDIPDWIKNDTEYEKLFVRGLVDTDGCLYIHRHTIKGKLHYNLGFCFTNFSKKLILSVSLIFNKFGIKHYVKDNGTRIFIYSQKSVVDYLTIFKTSNTRISNKYKEWKLIKESSKLLAWRDRIVV